MYLAVWNLTNSLTRRGCRQVMGAASKFKKLLGNRGSADSNSKEGGGGGGSKGDEGKNDGAANQMLRRRNSSGDMSISQTQDSESTSPPTRRRLTSFGRASPKKLTDEQRVCDNCFIRYKRQQPAVRCVALRYVGG